MDRGFDGVGLARAHVASASKKRRGYRSCMVEIVEDEAWCYVSVAFVD